MTKDKCFPPKSEMITCAKAEDLEMILAHEENVYLGFVDSRRERDKRGVRLPVFYVLERDSAWLLVQNDNFRIGLKKPGKISQEMSLGELREDMRRLGSVVLTNYKTYKKVIIEGGIQPYESPYSRMKSFPKAK